MLLKEASLYFSYVTLVGTGKRIFGTLWPVLVANFFIRRLEITVLTGKISFGTYFCYMSSQTVPLKGHPTTLGTCDSNVLTVIQMGV